MKENEMAISSEKLHFTDMWLGTKTVFILKTKFLSATDKKIFLKRRKVFDPKVCGSNK